MSRAWRCALLCAAAMLVAFGWADSVAARGGGRGGGGIGRGGGGRGGPAAGGSFGQNRPAGGFDRGMYNARGPAAGGNFGMQYPRQGEWQGNREERLEAREDRRDARQQDRMERREDWQEYADDHDAGYDDDRYYYGDYDEPAVAVLDEGSYWTLPCRPTVMAMGGTVYYVCGTDWYVRAYVDGEVAYTIVANPTGH